MTGSTGHDIHLDTSFLIRALVVGSAESDLLREWLRDGVKPRISTLVWGEFLCGPNENRIEALARRVARTHVPVGTDEASEAARLFNETGRRRGSFADCIVAATAKVAGTPLATSNPADFERFVGAGLELVG